MTKALMDLIHAYAEAHGADMSNVPASDEASTALKAALEQQGEPVAWMDNDGNISDNNDHGMFNTPLYTAAPAPQPQTDAEYQHMTTNGAKAWAGVDPQELRTGAA